MDSAVLFFFFQAEDGIRDTSVTGVQTCALPIWLLTEPPALRPRRHRLPAQRTPHTGRDAALQRSRTWTTPYGLRTHSTRRKHLAVRSEERRVGKECRSRWSAYHDKKNKRQRHST